MPRINGFGNPYYHLVDDWAHPQLAPYNGCGAGFIVVSKETDKVLQLSYSFDPNEIVHTANVGCCEGAGKVLAETQTTITYQVNFSCWTACLF